MNKFKKYITIFFVVIASLSICIAKNNVEVLAAENDKVNVNNVADKGNDSQQLKDNVNNNVINDKNDGVTTPKGNENNKVDNQNNGQTTKPDIKKGWDVVEGKKVYIDSTGKRTVGWTNIDGKTYYFDEVGFMKTSWVKINDIWYYLESTGERATGLKVIDKQTYYLDAGSGARKTGWVNLDNKWRYFDVDGTMKTGWKLVDGIWYYMDGDGIMKTGWLLDCGKWYYLNINGAMATGWVKVDNIWYYLNVNGSMATGWAKVNNIWYYLNGNGAMAKGWAKANNMWYYLNDSGAMVTGWMLDCGKWYYLNSNGDMKTGWFNENNIRYYLASDGAMQAETVKIGKSGMGQDIIAYKISKNYNAKHKILMTFEVHGFEDDYYKDGQVLVDAAQSVVEYYAQNIGDNVQMFIIPSVNPDGLKYGTTNNGKGRTQISGGIDINRDFDYEFKHYTSARNKNGNAPFSSPEARAIRDLVEKEKFNTVLDFHGWENSTIGDDNVAKHFRNEIGIKTAYSINRNCNGFLVAWAKKYAQDACLVEFPERLSKNKTKIAEHVINSMNNYMKNIR